jgi:hypothetical protein
MKCKIYFCDASFTWTAFVIEYITYYNETQLAFLTPPILGGF